MSFLKRLLREAEVWSRVKPGHRNILCLRGYCRMPDQIMPCLVSSACWSDLRAYLTANLVKPALKLKLLLDVASGLEYLHQKGIVHGDLRAANVFVNRSPSDDELTALLGDFGMSDVPADVEALGQYHSVQQTNLNWLAPELAKRTREDGEPPRVSKEADIYAFGCVYLEVLSLCVPFEGVEREDVYTAKEAGQTPQRPSRIEDAHWSFMEECWRVSKQSRPKASDAVSRTNGFLGLAEGRTPELPSRISSLP